MTTVGIEGSAATMSVEATGNMLHAQDSAAIVAGALLSLAVDDSLFAFNTITGNTVATEPRPGHVGIGNPIVITGDRNHIGFNDTSDFGLHPDSPYSVLLWNDPRPFVNGVAEENVVEASGPVLDETDNRDTPWYDGLNYLLDE